MKQLAKTFKAGTPFTFTATFKATFLEPAAGAGPAAVALPNVDAASLETSPEATAQDAEVVPEKLNAYYPAAAAAPDAEVVVPAEVAS